MTRTTGRQMDSGLVLFKLLAPGMLQNLCDGVALINGADEHVADEVNAVVAQFPWHSETVVHDLVDAVEWILLVDYCV